MSELKQLIIVKITGYEGKDSWLQVGGDHLEIEGTMFGIVSVYEDGAELNDLGYATEQEALAAVSGKSTVPIVRVAP